MKKAIIFGSGNIGKGFLAQLCQQASYEITFVDVSEKSINRLNEIKEYDIISLEDKKHTTIKNYKAINSVSEKDKLFNSLKEADLILTAIGINNLKYLNEYIKFCSQENPEITVIACENAIRATSSWIDQIDDLENKDKLNYIDCVIDRIVPSNQIDDNVYTEKYYSLVIDKNMIKKEVDLEVEITDNIDFAIQRKLFLVNALHCYIAWLGIHNNYQYIHETIIDVDISKRIENLKIELAHILEHKFNKSYDELIKFADNCIQRFKNKELKDTVIRVGKGILRKLSKNDRFITPYNYSIQNNLENKELKKAIDLAMIIKNPEDPEIQKRDEIINQNGLEKALEIITS